ncbi:CsbD family protein [Streptomyces sp. NBC_00820]|uniref:CsbD family protein n=1 Tax=Streptomyces sp. NBC_00820 TaxID=2975842 RepID=UPI002ED02EAA|nr:CsbD family protein [Streptomyces sp. NBC_00820]
MSTSKRIKAKAEQTKGKIKEETGRALGNEEMTAKGHVEKSKGDLREAGEKAKGSARKAKDVFKP